MEMVVKNLEGINFKGTFRDYQQRVLDSFEKHISDGKLNVVAAPGSGKTILGLEIICRLKSPCIILSPTVTIRDQWGERFADFFIDEKSSLEEFYSSNLNELKVLNSITYQALYSAMNKVKVEDDEESVDYSNIDLFKIVKEQNIQTICLDEAHHLQNEWQKALELFIKKLPENTKIISLTATPPYDANPAEWFRYKSICGGIDEEIFVPELVKTNTLCPHQDFIYFNFPTEEEAKEFNEYKEKSDIALQELYKAPLMQDVFLRVTQRKKEDYDFLYTNAEECVALLIVFEKMALKVDKKLKKMLTTQTKLPEFNLRYAEIAINFLLTNEITTKEEKDLIFAIFKKYSLVEKRKVCLDLNDKLKKRIFSSLGKLGSIEKIVGSEYEALKDKLRLLVLTDYIKKESVKFVGTDEKITNISVVSIFETLRRKYENIPMGVLSGTLVILPTILKDYLTNVEKWTKKQFELKEIEGTTYSVYNFKGNNKQKVQIVSKIFKQGLIKVLVGTKSLLGEGWDSPCINSLILASFVGSFMLSNQMRGRAIRIDKENPDKVSNIWHLATVEADYALEENKFKREMKKSNENFSELRSCDLDMLERRFECFVAPNYLTKEIESGLDRISFIKPPYDKEGIENINKGTLTLSKNRDYIKKSWEGELAGNARTMLETKVPKEKKIPSFVFKNVLLQSAILIALTAIVYLLEIFSYKAEILIVSIILLPLLLFFSTKIINKILSHLTPKKSIKTMAKAVLKTLKDIDLIDSNCFIKAKVENHRDVAIILCGASTREENIFNTAITELFSPIENPRYILIKKIRASYDYTYSFACPTVIGQNKDFATIFQRHIKKNTEAYELVYTRNEEGRKFILKCRENSYISRNQKQITKKYKVSKWK